MKSWRVALGVLVLSLLGVVVYILGLSPLEKILPASLPPREAAEHATSELAAVAERRDDSLEWTERWMVTDRKPATWSASDSDAFFAEVERTKRERANLRAKISDSVADFRDAIEDMDLPEIALTRFDRFVEERERSGGEVDNWGRD